MRLGVDIDGTLTTAYYWLPLFNQHFKKTLKPRDILHYEHHIDLGITLEAFQGFRLANLTALHQLAEPRPHAAVAMQELLASGHQTFLITAREKSLKLLTKQWLKVNQIPYTRLFHLGNTEKAALARALGIELFLEDRYETALGLARCGIPTLLFNTCYNQAPEHPLILRIDTWEEALYWISRLSNQEGRQVR